MQTGILGTLVDFSDLLARLQHRCRLLPTGLQHCTSNTWSSTCIFPQLLQFVDPTSAFAYVFGASAIEETFDKISCSFVSVFV
jgi:hypothetical protein